MSSCNRYSAIIHISELSNVISVSRNIEKKPTLESLENGYHVSLTFFISIQSAIIRLISVQANEHEYGISHTEKLKFYWKKKIKSVRKFVKYIFKYKVSVVNQKFCEI